MDFARLVLWPEVAKLLIVLVSCALSICANESSVYFALMVSSAPTLNTSGVVSAVDQALGVINGANSSVLPGIRLQYTGVLDTQVSTNIKSIFRPWLANKLNGLEYLQHERQRPCRIHTLPLY